MKQSLPFLRSLGAVVLNLIITLAFAAPLRSYMQNPGPDSPWFYWVGACLLYVVFVLQAVWMTRWVDKRPLSDLRLGFGRPARLAAWWGSGLTLALLLLYVGLTQVAGVTGWSWNAGVDSGTAVLMSLVFLMVGPGEEFIFRGYVLRKLEAYGPAAAAIVSSLLFAAIHAPFGRSSPLELTALFLHGYFFAVLAQRTNSIWPGVIIHSVYDVLTGLIWTGSATYSVLAFDTPLGWTKMAYKSLMVLGYLAMLWVIDRKSKEKTYESRTGGRQAANAAR
ncbi:MAG: Abortive infection protein [Symbiobacteriaceae bacterium]|jgi:membrane protease YdiL (CAAX protease family)|nr:Abortive infection protein [Symbiobacteriaceae bacterium]